MAIGEAKLTKEMKRMNEINRIDATLPAEDIGRIIDMHNKNIDMKKEREYNKEMADRNLYYWKLWQRAMEEIRLGGKPKQKERKIYLPPNLEKGTLILPNNAPSASILKTDKV